MTPRDGPCYTGAIPADATKPPSLPARIASTALFALALLSGCNADAPAPKASLVSPAVTQSAPRAYAGLPAEAIDTLALIKRGGPFPYRKDGTVFQNREKRLPGKPRGYYREYTVPTPGERTRGARRIVAGGQPPVVFYYTADHYRSFTRLPDAP